MRGVHDWFGTVSLDGASPTPARAVEELARMLDEAQPALLDTTTSRVAFSDGAIVVTLEHRDDPESEIWIEIGEHSAVVAWLSTHEHVDDDLGERPWTSVVSDLVAAVLRGEYAVEETCKGEWVVRSRVIDLVHGVVISSMGLLFWQLIPRRTVRREPRALDYACRG